MRLIRPRGDRERGGFLKTHCRSQGTSGVSGDRVSLHLHHMQDCFWRTHWSLLLRDEPLEKEGPVPHLGRRDPFRSQAGEGEGDLESAMEGWMEAVGRPRGGKRDIDTGATDTGKSQSHRERWRGEGGKQTLQGRRVFLCKPPPLPFLLYPFS